MSRKSHLGNLKQALEVFVEDLEGFEGALRKFEEALLAFEEEAIKGGAPEHQNAHNLRLLSPSEEIKRKDLKEDTKSRQHHRHLELVGEEASCKQR